MDTQDRAGSSMNDSGTGREIDPPVTQPCSPDVPRKRHNHSVDPDTWGHTYFVQRGNAIKIGHSAIPKQRISSLQVAFAEPLEILAIVPNTVVSEAAAHQKFAHLRMTGEWFRAEPELIEFILAVKFEAGQIPRKPGPDIATTNRGLIAKRALARADTPDGHTYSNLVELLKNHAKALSGSFELQHLPRLMAVQMKRLEGPHRAAGG